MTEPSSRGSVYLVVQAIRSRYGAVDRETGLRPVQGLKIVGIRQSRPAVLERDQVALKITVVVPDAVFEPVAPAALVVVPTDLAMRAPVEVEAQDANDVGEA